jgi:serine/threonine protein kinase
MPIDGLSQYMAPEGYALFANNKKLPVELDVWALMATLYFAAEKELPFPSEKDFMECANLRPFKR